MRRVTENSRLEKTFKSLIDVAELEADEFVPDLIVFSHLRWNFVFQRPQHIMTRFAKHRRVYFVEEPVLTEGGRAHLEVTTQESTVRVVVPKVPRALAERGPAVLNAELAEMLERYVHQVGITLDEYTAWYYTPMALEFTRHLTPTTVVYDCMDELSAFRGAPEGLLALEAELLAKADVVFTGGHALYAAKKGRHPNIHAIPSSIDRAHFARARLSTPTPTDQAGIGGPRIGFFGVVDERFDIELLRAVAEHRSEWSFVILGPVVKIDPAHLPRRPNIHYLGMKKYAELPAYLAGWDVAMLPFARNESTRFISPTKTPEYLAAGCPVVSTSIRDVVRPYGEEHLVKIADTPDEFSGAIDGLLNMGPEKGAWLDRVDRRLRTMSWAKTQAQMAALERACRVKKLRSETSSRFPVPSLYPAYL
jgi:UDP-galactopyranose mutase